MHVVGNILADVNMTKFVTGDVNTTTKEEQEGAQKFFDRALVPLVKCYCQLIS
jgi:hypothetical protein